MNMFVKHNQLQRKDLENHPFMPTYIMRCRYVCVECGEPVSPAVVKFFKDEIIKVKCYKCQQKGGE